MRIKFTRYVRVWAHKYVKAIFSWPHYKQRRSDAYRHISIVLFEFFCYNQTSFKATISRTGRVWWDNIKMVLGK